MEGVYGCRDAEGYVFERYAGAQWGMWVVRPDGCLGACCSDVGGKGREQMMRYFERVLA